MNKKDALDIVLSEFLKIAEIPRPSHHEEKISAYLYQWARDRGLSVRRDELGEVIVDKAASPGCEKAPRVIFQAHMDMVCVAEEGRSYDPLRDPIRVINDGSTLRADGTSLGADDGIGLAMCLYLLQDDSLRHGPIRAIFTTNEEDGMDSVALDKQYLDGDYLVNLDWETIGSLCNSCAGGDFFNFSRKAVWAAPAPGSRSLTLGFRGLLGGHSGVGINKGHANALVSVATLLSMLHENGVDCPLASFSGGQAKNAIPAAASAVVAIAPAQISRAEETISRFRAEFSEAFGNIETGAEFICQFSDQAPELVLEEGLSRALVGLMTAVPNNVHTMSPFIDGLVESSSNLGVISLGAEQLGFTLFARSSVAYQASQIGLICAALAERFGFSLESEGHVPGWAVDPNSRLTRIACEAYRDLTGADMVVEPVHAGVECGAFAEKNPHLDMIAIGPTLSDVHTPGETCSIADVETMTALLVEILLRIASE